MNEVVVGVYSQFNDYFELGKPRIALLVVFTAFVGMLSSAGEMPSNSLLINTLLGTALASLAAGLFNNYIDRDIDPHMPRTRMRGLAAGRIPAQNVLGLAVVLTVVSSVQLTLYVNALAAMLAMSTIALYVFVYSLWLKRSSSLCTEVGGLAGALPPLIGCAAVSNSITSYSLLLFLLLFLWQPAHFWALALLRVDEYKAVNIPMLPVVKGERVTKNRMLWYTVLLLPTSMLAVYCLDAEPAVLALTLVMNLFYIVKTQEFCRLPVSRETAMSLFVFSIIYIFAIFSLVLFAL